MPIDCTRHFDSSLLPSPSPLPEHIGAFYGICPAPLFLCRTVNAALPVEQGFPPLFSNAICSFPFWLLPTQALFPAILTSLPPILFFSPRLRSSPNIFYEDQKPGIFFPPGFNLRMFSPSPPNKQWSIEEISQLLRTAH